MSDFITTYATPLDRAKSLRDEFVDYANSQGIGLPSKRYVQVGEIVRDCEAVIVSVNGLGPEPTIDPVKCASPSSATFLLDIVRGCAVVSDRAGRSIPDAVEAVSEIAAVDGQLLDNFARQIDPWVVSTYPASRSCLEFRNGEPSHLRSSPHD
jgi:hypothetical protein